MGKFQVFEITPSGREGRSIGIFEAKNKQKAVERAGELTFAENLRVFPVKVTKSKSLMDIESIFKGNLF